MKALLIYILSNFFLVSSGFEQAVPAESPIKDVTFTQEQQAEIDRLCVRANFFIIRQFDSLLYYTQDAIRLSRAINYTEGEIVAHNIYARGLIGTGQYIKADSILSYANTLSRQVNYSSGLAENTLIKGLLFQRLGEYERASEYMEMALVFYQKIGDKKGLQSTYGQLGTLYKSMNKNEDALFAYQQALRIHQEAGNRSAVGVMHSNVATVYESQQQYFKALEHYQESLSIAISLKDSLNIGVCHNNMGYVHEILEDYEVAKDYYQSFLDIMSNNKVDNQQFLCVAYTNLGNIELKQGNFEAAYDYYQIVLKKAYALNEKYEIALALNLIGDVERKLDNYVPSIAAHAKALEIFEDVGLGKEAALSKIGLAESYKQTRAYKQALVYALDAYKWVEKNPSTENIEEKVTEVLAKIYEGLGEYKQAYTHYKRHKKLNEDKQSVTTMRELSSYQTKADYERKSREEAIKQEVARKNRINFLTLIFLAIAALLFFAWERYHTVSFKNKLITEQHKDISTQKEQLEQQAQRLESINHTKDKLFAIISHDLRGPIGSLETVLELLLSKELDKEEFIEIASDLKQSTTSVHQMLENLLQWSTAQMHGGMKTKMAVVDPYQQAANVVSFLREIAKEKNINIQNSIPKESYIQADQNHFNLILRNLISNALKFTEEGGSVQISAKKEDADLHLSVTDTGIGMSKAQLEKIFDGKSTVPKWGTADERGVGLGLVLCKEIVTENKGKIWVESTLGEGSTFFFSLPLATVG